MGLLKGSWSFSRYRVAGKMPEQFDDFIDERLKRYAFTEITSQVAEKIAGWTSLENVLDTEFSYAKYKLGAYIIFSLRMDRRSIPPSLLKLKVMEAEKKHLADSGKKRLYRPERDDIKERVQLELMARAPRVPSFHEICWFPESSSLIFGSLSPQIMEDFEKYFKETFQLTLLPLLPWEAITAGSANTTSVEPAADSLHRPSQGGAPATNQVCWGREFLTWLWFKSEERNGVVDFPDGGAKEILFVQRLVLAAGDGEYAETVVCQGLHTDMKEGKEALRRGKKIKEARLRVSEDTTKWEFTFKADHFQFQSLKLPAISEGEDELDREGQNIERIYLVEKAVTTMDRLFVLFASLRQSPTWPEELSRMERWLNQ